MLCNDIQFQMNIAMKRYGSNVENLTLSAVLDDDQCDQLLTMMENPKSNTTLVFTN